MDHTISYAVVTHKVLIPAIDILEAANLYEPKAPDSVPLIEGPNVRWVQQEGMFHGVEVSWTEEIDPNSVAVASLYKL
jgi:hypothetical protein|tara:strand:+ start:3312 stop:3545 length:234 start_codon:yes stop_codon:yes gene_type:complete